MPENRSLPLSVFSRARNVRLRRSARRPGLTALRAGMRSARFDVVCAQPPVTSSTTHRDFHHCYFLSDRAE